MDSLIRKEVLPFLLSLAAMIGAALLADALLHVFDLVWIGRYLGIPGVLLILASFGHSLRKRKIIKSGDPVRMLVLHQRLAWSGSLLVLIHAGVHFNAVLAWLALAAMIINVASGLTGKYLLHRSQRRLREARSELRGQGASDAEIERRLHWDSLAVDLVKQWRTIHIPITLCFGILALAHIVAVFLFWGWW